MIVLTEEAVQKPRLFAEQDMAEGEVHPLAFGLSAVFTTRCPGKETVNEDAAALFPFDSDSGVLAVADGLGGMPAGEQAARIALGELRAALNRARSEGNALRGAILDGIENANRAVSEKSAGATTLAVVEIQNGTVRPYHVGDSMILLVGQRGKMKLQTISHSPVGYAVEAGMLDEREAMHHEERHVISNIIGTPEMRIEIGPTIRMARHDTLLLASDGLFDNLHVDEIVERIRKGPLEKAMKTLAGDARARMQTADHSHPSKPDDLTFVLFRRGT